MQQAAYNKISIAILGLAVFCAAVASLVTVFFLVPIASYGPFGMGYPLDMSDDTLSRIKGEISQKESVLAFKEKFPDFREEYNESHDVRYSIQARNSNTGNVLSLDINYYPIGPPGSADKFDSHEHLRCIPGQHVWATADLISTMEYMGSNLFLHETIRSTDCLDDGWEPAVVTGNQ